MNLVIKKATTGKRKKSDRKKFQSSLGNIERLYNLAKPGDIIIIPGRGPFDTVLIGELEKEIDCSHLIAVDRFPDSPIPYRPVRWIAQDIKKRDFSDGIAKLLINRLSIIEINDPSFRKEIYQKIYPNFSFDSNVKSTIRGDNYDSDPEGIIDTIKLIQYYAAAFYAIKENKLTEFFALDFDAAINKFYHKEIDFALHFNSPGRFLLKSADIVTLFVCLAISVSSGAVAQEEIRDNLNLINSVKNPGENEHENEALSQASSAYNQLMNSIGLDQFNTLQEKNRLAKEKMGLRTAMKKVTE